MKTPLTSTLAKEYGAEAGADVVGIAAAADFAPAPEGCKPSDHLEGCLSVIVLGAAFPREALTMSGSEYTALRNDMVSGMTDRAKAVAKRVKAHGHQVKAISAIGGKFVGGRHFGHISLKHAAELAGLGMITRNYLFTSPQYGNLLWFSAVLTDAELTPDPRISFGICDPCGLCAEVCPSGALDIPGSFGHGACAKACWKQVDRKWELHCFACRSVCPYRFGMK